MSEDYTPRGKTAVTLDRAFELVESVPYDVSARWLFYRLLQEGYYSKKTDYKNKFLPATSKARHAFYKQWRPDTLADETREPIIRGNGFKTPGEWVRAVQSGLECELDKWYSQEQYIELWYEARAMTDQFRHYTRHINLRPMGGQPSIRFKWDSAKDIERIAKRYSNPITVLYFGDLDTAGETIAQVVERDVRKWCSVPFEFVHCGLTLDQVQRYNVPENPEKPGQYQWEALTDTAASEIISARTKPFISHGAFSDVCAKETAISAWLRAEIANLEPPAALAGDVA